MKGYLKNIDGIFQLAPKVTTVGREGCDLAVQSPGVDYQHAIIEFSEQEMCFVLQDLNTAQGTYINDCRVQNAAVRLAPGDVIRFGFSGTPYELEVDSQQQLPMFDMSSTQILYPPVHQRAAWTQPLTVISDQPPVQIITTDPGLPQLKHGANTVYSQYPPNQNQLPASAVIPRPPTTIRGRPLSAGAVSRKPAQYQDTRSVVGVGWLSGGSPARTIPTPPTQSAEIMLLQEKEQAILRLNEEVKRLNAYQNDCQKKEDLIRQLRDEITDLHRKLRVNDSVRSAPDQSDQAQRYMQLENEVTLRKIEIQSLKEQIATMKENERTSPGNVNRQELNERILEINSLSTELERVRKDKNITAGLVSQMQKDMADKDTTVSRLKRDLEAIKTEIGEKDIQISSLQSKFRKTQENKKTDEEVEAKENELAALRHKYKSSENKMQDQSEVIASLKEELEKFTRQTSEEKEGQKRMQTELDAARAKSTDFERAERQVRVDLEQISKRMERFRNRVLQTTFSTPGIRAPDKELADDELLESLKAIIDERTEFMRKLQDSKEMLTSANSTKKDVVENSKKLKQSLNEAVERLRDRGLLSSRLRQEIDMVQTVSLDESVSWMRDIIITLLQVTSTWEAEIEAALEQCGINIKISDDEPWKHITHLKGVFEETKGECVTLRSRLVEVSEEHKAEMQAAMDALRAEMEERVKDQSLTIEIEGNEKLNKAIEEIRSAEAEKLENALEAERAKFTELEASLEQIKVSSLEREEEISSHKEVAREAVESVDAFKARETELMERISSLEKSRDEEVARVTQEKEGEGKKAEECVAGLKEQIRQHSVTICTMEERLNKVIKKSKDYQAEVTQLKKNNNELKSKASRPSPPPKPKVIIQKPVADAVALEQTIVQLQREVTAYKTQVHEQQDVITGLRRDVAGASARLSDMAGELSESQKEEMERNRGTVVSQEKELSDMRQQMVKLSQIVDSKSSEITELNNDIAKQRASLSKYKHISDDRDLRIKDLENMLTKEKEESKKHLSLIEDEGRITSELTAMGAQCRGDRHEQTICRQREALTELRARIKLLEQDRPPLPTHDQALQQVMMLKKELAELRASQALQDTAHVTSVLSNSQHQILQQQISKARGIDTQAQAEVDMERSAHRETIEALEASEGTYLMLLRNMASALEMEEVGGLRSMAHIPKDERFNLVSDRERAVQLLASRIKVLQERITRKDELLQGYERDLAKLRQAEKLAEQKSAQLDSLVDDVRFKAEESQYLRESLNRTRDRLDQEKRLNSAVKTKKTFHLESENVTAKPWPRHKCPPEDILGKERSRKKNQAEKMKRKNYEISTLKSELSTRDRDLQGARRKMVQLENTMGMETDRDPLEPPAIASH